MKVCRKCGAEYEGLACKPCKSAYDAARHEKLRDVRAAKWHANKDTLLPLKAKYREENKEKILAKAKAYREANGDKVRAAVAKWRKANPDYHKTTERKEYVKKWREENIEYRKGVEKTYRLCNKDKLRIKNMNRRAAVRTQGKLSTGLAVRLLKLQRGKCACCGEALGADYHLDHIMPLALGGTNTDDNMQLLTATCNMQKHAKHPIDFMQQKGFLI